MRGNPIYAQRGRFRCALVYARESYFVSRVFNMMYPIPAYKTLELG